MTKINKSVIGEVPLTFETCTVRLVSVHCTTTNSCLGKTLDAPEVEKHQSNAGTTLTLNFLSNPFSSCMLCSTGLSFSL